MCKTRMAILWFGVMALASAGAMDLGGKWNVSGDGIAGVARLPGTLADAGLGARQDYETWSALTNRGEKGALRLSHVYRGKATWSRTVEVPEELSGKPLEVFLERVLWTSELKVDGKSVGRRDSLGTPHVYRFAPGELAPGRHQFVLEIDNSSHYCFTGKSHGWGWSTQTCWNGVIGRFELREANPLDETQVFAPYPAKEVRVEFGGAGLNAEIDGIRLKGRRDKNGYRFALPFNPTPWSEANPRLYALKLSAGGHEREVQIGFRTIERRGNKLFLNGVPLWIRGDVDNCQFPLTGYPAMTPAEWRRQIRVQKENGANAMRFHTWTPPEAAFKAADELGFFLFVETGFWADAAVPMNNIGRGNAALDDFCRRELFAIASTYGNHASFLGIGVGNELGKCDFEIMDGWMKELKARDQRRLTMASTARKVAESDDLMVTHLYPGIGPVRCRFRAGTDWDYEDVYSKTPIPTVAHEIGQWPVYPLWSEIFKYDGLLKPFDWEAMRCEAEKNGTLRFNREYHRVSLKTNRFMYKDEVEGYLRTPSCAGLQLLDMRDYTGQGEALVGWLDAFFDAKAGLSELPPFSSVLRPVAFLARIGKFVLAADETFAAELYVRNVSEETLPAGMRYPYSFAGRTGYMTLDSEVVPGEFSKPLRVLFCLDPSMAARRQELRFGESRWSVFVMDDAPKCGVPAGVTVTADPDAAAKALAAGGRVVYTGRSVGAVRGRFVPVYWSSAYFPIYDPCAMLGTWFDEDHPAFAQFPTEDWMDRQWRTLTDASLVHEAKGLAPDFRPIAMPVPDIHLSRLFATLFELRVGKGRLLVCGYPIDRMDCLEARQLRRSVLEYAASSQFEPATSAAPEWFVSFACRKRPEDIDDGDWREERLGDGSVRMTLHNPPRKAGEYKVLFKEDGIVSATCEGRECKTMSAIPVAMAIASVTAADVADGRIEFVFSSKDAEVPPVASVSFLPSATAATGIAGYSIVRPKSISDTDAFVLADLRGLLSRGLGGAEIQVCTPDAAPAAKRIFFGIASPGFDAASLADQEHVVEIKNGDVYLFGGGTNGTRYAAYDFLQGVLGYKFFDGRGGMRVPDLKGATLANCVRRRKFAFMDRYLSCWGRCTGRESAMFLFRHGMNGAMDGSFAGFMKRECDGGAAAGDFCAPCPASHAIVTYMPRNSSVTVPGAVKKLVGGDFEKLHPEWFSLKGGKRVFSHQRCLSNPDARAFLKKTLFANMAAHREPSYFDFSAGDTPGRLCECEGCMALEKKYGTTAGPLLDAIAEFCPEAARLYPRHCIKMLVYRKDQTQRPPTNLSRLPDNFVANFAPIDDDFSKEWSHANNADTLADLRAWCSLCRRTLVWYYPNPYGGVTPPFGNIERLANDMRIMKEAGVTGLNIEHNVGVSEMTGFTELQSYLLASLWADVSQDWRQLVREFLDFEYGAAAAGMAAYLDELESLTKATKSRFAWDASRSMAYYDYLTPERLMRWEGDFDRMETLLAGDKTRLHNLRRVRYNLDSALLAKYRDVSRALGDAAPSVASVADRIETIAAEIAKDCYCERYAGKAKKYVKSVADRVYLKRLMGKKGASGLPEKIFGNVPSDKVFVTLPISHDGGRQPDAAAAYGVAALFEGVKRPEEMKLPFVMRFQALLPNKAYVKKAGRGVDADNIGPRGEYRFYDMGEVTVTPDCYIELNTYWFQANISEAYVAGSFNKAKVYASLKFQGPAFYANDKASKNQVWCDRIVVVQE